MRQADLDAVMALADSLPEAPAWPREAYEAAVTAGGSPPRIAIVSEDEAGSGRAGISGFAIASLVAGVAELESIAVAARAQRQGIATALVSALIAQLKAHGAAELLLEVRASNHPAAGLYARSGFEFAGRRTGYYRDPVEDALLLRRAI